VVVAIGVTGTLIVSQYIAVAAHPHIVITVVVLD